MTKKECCVSRRAPNNYFKRETGSGFNFLDG